MKYEYKREPLTADEMNRIALACRDVKEKLVVWVLLDLGLRVAEFCSITKDSIDWQTHRLRVLGKGNKRRLLLLQGRTRELLEAYISVHDSIDFTPRTAERIVKRVANRAKIRRPCSPHILRHSFAVDAIRKGTPLPMLMKMLGHENLSTTQIYSNLSPEDVIQAMEKFL